MDSRLYATLGALAMGVLPPRPSVNTEYENRKLIVKALNTFKYRMQNKIKKIEKFRGGSMEIEEFKKLTHRTVTEIGHTLPSEDLCTIFYNEIAKHLGYVSKKAVTKDE